MNLSLIWFCEFNRLSNRNEGKTLF